MFVQLKWGLMFVFQQDSKFQCPFSGGRGGGSPLKLTLFPKWEDFVRQVYGIIKTKVLIFQSFFFFFFLLFSFVSRADPGYVKRGGPDPKGGAGCWYNPKIAQNRLNLHDLSVKRGGGTDSDHTWIRPCVSLFFMLKSSTVQS